jgi:hypothetical protein
MIGVHSMRALPRFAALVLAVQLGACGQMSGLSGLSLLGGDTQDAAAAAPDAQLQIAVLNTQETPPLPKRRPGKRPPALVRGSQANAGGAAPANEPAPEQKPESSGISLASLGNFNLFSGSAEAGGPDAVLIDQKPVEAYSLLALRIKYCWLNPSSPRLPNHGFYSDLPAGEVKEAKMVVYEKSPDGRRGSTVFKVDITAEPNGALVAAHNYRLDKALEASFKSDLARWAKGDDRCKP